MLAEKPGQFKFNHRIDMLIFILIGGLVALLPLVFFPTVALTFLVPKISLFYALGIALLPLFLIKMAVLRSKIPQNIINYAIIGYFIFVLLSTIFSVQPLASLISMGIYRYGYGLIFLVFNILLFYSTMTSTSIQKYRSIFLYLILISATIASLIGLAQFFRWPFLSFILGFRKDLRAGSTLENPVYFGGYLALVLPFLLYAYMSSELPATGLSRRRWQLSPMERRPTVGRVSIPAATMERRPTEGAPRRWRERSRSLLVLVAIILISSQVVSLSRAAWLASLGGSIFFLISYQSILKKRFNKKVLIGMAVGAFILILAASLIVSVQTGKRWGVLSRLTDIFKLRRGSSFTRLQDWRLASKVFIDYPFFGYGMGTYYFAVEKYKDLPYIKTIGENYDAHNFIFNTLATQGLFALIALLSIYGIFFYTGLKKRKELSLEDQLFSSALMASVLSILIFRSFNPENVAIDPYAWIFMGISWGVFYPRAQRKEINLKFASQTIAILFILSFLSLEIIPLRIFTADRSYLSGIIYGEDRFFKQAIEQNPLVPNYYHTFALKKITEGLKTNNRQEINLSIKYYKKLFKLFPINPRAHQYLGDIYVNLGKFSEASKEYQIALEQNPYNPVALNNLAWSYQNINDYQQAIKYYQRAIELDKNQSKSYLHLAEIYEKLGQEDKARYFKKLGERRTNPLTLPSPQRGED